MNWVYLCVGVSILVLEYFVLLVPRVEVLMAKNNSVLYLGSKDKMNGIKSVGVEKRGIWYGVNLTGSIVALCLPFVLYPLNLFWILAYAQFLLQHDFIKFG